MPAKAGIQVRRRIKRNLDSRLRGNDELKPFEDFYRFAQARELSMHRNLLAAMKEHQAKSVVLVTGGFHSAGLDKLLKKDGVSAVNFVPRLTKLDTAVGPSYLSVFTQEKTPLDQLFDVLGLETLRGRYPGELSLGLERRVALARAFAVMPDILLLDEPFVSLDEHTADRLRAHLVDLWQARATTVLMVTHNVREAARLADRLLLMNRRPASLVGDVAVPVPRTERDGPALRAFLEALTRDHPETVLA